MANMHGLELLHTLQESGKAFVCSPDCSWSCSSSVCVEAYHRLELGSDYPVFFQMCDSIQGVRRIIGGVAGSNTVPKPISHDTGVGLNKALANYASWFKNEYLPDREFSLTSGCSCVYMTQR